MRMGLPKLLTSDQGREFRNELDKKIMGLLGIKRHFTTPYHPQVSQIHKEHWWLKGNLYHQANGLDERWNQTLKQMIVKYTSERKEQWDTFLDTCVFAYNTAKHESSSYSPFELMFGRKAILPIDIEFESKDGADILKDYEASKEVSCFVLWRLWCYINFVG